MKENSKLIMWPSNFNTVPNISNFLPRSFFRNDFKSSNINHNTENNEYGLDEIEVDEVFADHIFMDQRLHNSLYAGSFDCLDDFPKHPPIALTGLTLELFSKTVPNNGLEILDMDYVSAVSEATRISPCAMIIAMIYLERLQLKNSEYLETVSPPGLFVVTMLVASKFLFEDDEDIVTNKMWSEALSFDVKELNDLEKDFLAAIDWKVLVDSAEFFRYLLDVEMKIAVQQSSLRQWLSYHEMLTLTKDPNFQVFWKKILDKVMKTVFLCTLGYLASAVTLNNVGSALLQTQSTNRTPKSSFLNSSIQSHILTPINQVTSAVKDAALISPLPMETSGFL